MNKDDSTLSPIERFRLGLVAAGQRAIALAEQTNTDLVIWQNGGINSVSAKEWKNGKNENSPSESDIK